MDKDSDQAWPTVVYYYLQREKIQSSRVSVLSFSHLWFYKAAPMALNRWRHDGCVITGPHSAFITYQLHVKPGLLTPCSLLPIDKSSTIENNLQYTQDSSAWRRLEHRFSIISWAGLKLGTQNNIQNLWSHVRSLSTSPFMYAVHFAMQLWVWRANLRIQWKGCLLNTLGFPGLPTLHLRGSKKKGK